VITPLLRAVVSLACFGLCGCSLARLEKSLLYQPAPATVGNWEPPPAIGFEEANFTAADGTALHGWFKDVPERRAVVLFMHGNGGNVATWAGSVHGLSDRDQVAVLVFDYRGYGKSTGLPDEAGIYADARAARSWLAERTGVREEDIVLLGRSLGGGVAVQLASELPPRGLILMNTFTSAPAAAQSFFPLVPTSWLMTQRYDSLSKISKYEGPLLMTHGEKDKVIPVAQAKTLFNAAASTQKQLILDPNGGHNDAPTEEYLTTLSEFWRKLGR
jgi:fermentation-respiration switch protein FrsA (DUF1100 family)